MVDTGGRISTHPIEEDIRTRSEDIRIRRLTNKMILENEEVFNFLKNKYLYKLIKAENVDTNRLYAETGKRNMLLELIDLGNLAHIVRLEEELNKL